MQHPKSKQFQQLQDEWYQKIKDSGFQDLENRRGELKEYTADVFASRYKIFGPEFTAAKEQYYRLAGQFLNDYKFESKFEQCVWELHAEGVSIRNIVNILTKRKFKTYKRMVHETIQRLSREMVTKNVGSKK